MKKKLSLITIVGICCSVLLGGCGKKMTLEDVPVYTQAVIDARYKADYSGYMAKQQGLKCVGFGAKTKWYFTLNALIREFAGYLRLTWKRHILIAAVMIMAATMVI